MEENELWQIYKSNPTLTNRNNLAEFYWPEIKKMALRYASKRVLDQDADVYLSYVSEALLKTIPKFDPLQAQFLMYFTPRLKGCLIDSIRDSDPLSRGHRKEVGSTFKIHQEEKRSGFENSVHPDSNLDVIDRSIALDIGFNDLISPLSKRQRLICLMYYKLEMSMKEIGKNLGISEASISKILKDVIYPLIRLRYERVQNEAVTNKQVA